MRDAPAPAGQAAESPEPASLVAGVTHLTATTPDYPAFRFVDYSTTLSGSALGIAYTSAFYSGGCPSWPYWQTELRKSWPVLAAAIGA